MGEAKPVGIDLGTTNSAVAWVDRSGRTDLVRNAEGELLTPSVVLFDDAEVVVGKEARNAAIVYPDHVAEWVKRDMGLPAYSRAIRGEYLPPEVIQACILRKLRVDLAEALGPEVKVVITVPAYFDEPRRKATADAGEMAGLTVLDIVNEPTAAALAFGEVHGYLSSTGGATERMTVLVYDLGGGTFDVTLLRLEPGKVRTLATDGDVRLGGHDWDMRLVDHAAERFKRTHGVDPRHDPAALGRLYSEVVEAKHSLSARGRATIRIDCAGRSDELRVTRDEFEELTADLLERTAHTARQLLAAAKLDWRGISRLLLVGGATRMPVVQRMLQEMSGMAPDHTVNPDEAVARGAALYASHLLAEQAEEGPGSGFQVTNVNSHSLGVEGIEQDTLRKTNVVLIPRNTPLPARFAERFITKTENQRSIVVQVLEGESSSPEECTTIGRTVIRDLPPGLPRGWPVEVTFEYGANGRLRVHAEVPGTHREVELKVERNVGLSDEGLIRWQGAVSSASGFDAFEALVGEVLGLDEPGTQAKASPATAPDLAPDADTRGTVGRPSHNMGAQGPPAPPARTTASPATAPDFAPDSDIEPPPAPPRRSDRAGCELPERRKPRPIPRGLIMLIGFVGSAIIGLGLGYLVIWWFFPESGLLHLW